MFRLKCCTISYDLSIGVAGAGFPTHVTLTYVVLVFAAHVNGAKLVTYCFLYRLSQRPMDLLSTVFLSDIPITYLNARRIYAVPRPTPSRTAAF